MPRESSSALVVFLVLFAILATGVSCTIVRQGAYIGPPELDPSQDVDKAPVAVNLAEPVYPEFARDANIGGTVLLRARIGEDGLPHEVRIIRGITGLNEAAYDAVKRCTFRPAQQNGQPVSAWLNIPVTFQY